jgi:Xaa-Pro aminopeptidase
MSGPSETLLRPVPPASEPSLDHDSTSDRRADVDAKQAQAAALLQETGCEGLLTLETENFAWLTSGGTARSTLDASELPALFYTSDQRWLLASNADTQRLFDEELDELGYQLKEWPWHWGREQLLADLCQGRRLLCDRPLGETRLVSEQFHKLRRLLTPYEQACARALGQIVAHALEATCRTITPGETEREVAGQVTHRLLHRGAIPLQVGVAADDRSKVYRRFGFTSAPIRKHAVVCVTARKYGLHATASRSICFGPPEPSFRQEHDIACKVGATYIASTWPDAVPREVLGAGRRVYQITGAEHEWLQCPQGFVTGRCAVESSITPQTEELFQHGLMVTWRASAGAGVSCDTFLVTDKGPRLLTPTEVWPLKRIRIQGADFVRPDLLQR